MNKEKIESLKKNIVISKKNILNDEAEIKKLEAGKELWYVNQPKKYDSRGELTPDYDAPNILTWIPNIGVEPVIEGDYLHIITIHQGGQSNAWHVTEQFSWILYGSDSDIEHYCIVRKPVAVS